jgi:hypothetical protein
MGDGNPLLGTRRTPAQLSGIMPRRSCLGGRRIRDRTSGQRYFEHPRGQNLVGGGSGTRETDVNVEMMPEDAAQILRETGQQSLLRASVLT